MLTISIRVPSIAVAVFSLITFFAPAVLAQDVKCEPEKVASKYPSLSGRTIKVAQDGESAPYSLRDPNDFNKIIGLDADMARAVFACIGVPVRICSRKMVRLVACGDCRPGKRDVGYAVLYA